MPLLAKDILNASKHDPKQAAVQVEKPEDILAADRIVFPGVGAFEQAMGVLSRRGYIDPLKEYIQACAFHSCSPLLGLGHSLLTLSVTLGHAPCLHKNASDSRSYLLQFAWSQHSRLPAPHHVNSCPFLCYP